MSQPVIDDYIRGGTQKTEYAAQDVQLWDCPLCSSSSCKVMKTERGVLNVVKCSDCSLIRVNPRLNSPDEVYRGDVAIYEEEERLVRSGQFPHHRDQNYRGVINKIRGYKPNGSWLDVGCSSGCFLRLARGQGWDLTAVEPSPQLGQMAREAWGLNVIEGFLEQLDLPAQAYDIVTLVDVFEHVVNPREVLAAARRVLKPDGILFVKVPNGLFNVLKFRARRLLRRPSGNDFDAYEHVCHYTQTTLRKMLTENGFDPLSIYVEAPIQLPVWQNYVGHYYEHQSPWTLSWKANLSRSAFYQMALLQEKMTGRIGYFAPNIGSISRPS